MSWRRLMAALLCTFCLTGCWDRVELEDQLLVVALGVDPGSQMKYRVTAYVPIAARIKAGALGGQGDEATRSGLLVAEGDSIAQAIYILNASVTRRITMRQTRLIAVSEALARKGLEDLYAELLRNQEIRQTVGFVVARGSAGELLKQARFTGESNPARIGEGVLLIEKHLHLSPPIRLHHMSNRTSAVGVDAFAAVAGLNRQITTGGAGQFPESAVAGDLARFSGNPVEIAGTALFRDSKMVGYLTVDETQALLALRGEMGKAYVTLVNPFEPQEHLMIRFGQENKPQSQVAIAQNGPRVKTRLIFEAEVMSGAEVYWDPAVRQKVEAAARAHMERQLRSLLDKLQQWQTDPVGFGLLFRGKFRTWDDWVRWDWRKQLAKLRVDVEAEMRVRRVGMTLGTQGTLGEEKQ